MHTLFKRALKTLILPPWSLLLLGVAGLVTLHRWPRVGKGLLITSISLLWLLCTPVIAGLLLGSLQHDPALDPEALPAADAIVVLSADTDIGASEYGGASVGALTLERLRYAAFLQRHTGLPLLVTGGQGHPESPPLADLMRAVLESEFQVSVTWSERESTDTLQNASLSAPILLKHGVRTILLVTHAWHMPRARACFEARGLTVIAAPTGMQAGAFEDVRSLIPRWSALRDSTLALHEYLGRVAYHLFYL